MRAIGPVAQLAFALEHQPARSEQRVAEHEPDPAQDRERVQPVERTAGVLAVDDGDAADHRADRRALHEARPPRAQEEAPVPHPAHALAPVAELERDAAEDQSEQHQQHREVERTEEHRIDIGKGREQPGADHHQPGLVAVPERRDRPSSGPGAPRSAWYRTGCRRRGRSRPGSRRAGSRRRSRRPRTTRDS